MKTTTIIGLCIALVMMCTPASAWLDGFDYRMPINVNNTGDNLTYYQYNFTAGTASIVSASKMSPNGSDCRITDASDVLQEFWNQTAFNSSSTKIWVNGSTLGNITNTTHYLYYGNSAAASVVNITNTFLLGDDFEPARTSETGLSVNKTFVSSTGLGTYPTNVLTTLDKALWTHNNSQYINYVASNTHIMVGKRSMPDGAWSLHDTGFTCVGDEHFTSSMGIDADGYIHISYDMHYDTLQYSRSNNPEDPSAFTVRSMTGSNEDRVTYPRFFMANDILFYSYRQGTATNVRRYQMINRYNDTTQTWATVHHPFIDCETNPDLRIYADNFAVDDDGSIHISFCFRTGETPLTHGNYSYAYSDDNGTTWKMSNGTSYSLPITQETAEKFDPGTVAGLRNVNHIDVDGNGHPHIAYDKQAPNGHENYYHAWHNGTAWQITQLTNYTDTPTEPSTYYLARPGIVINRTSNRVYVVGRHSMGDAGCINISYSDSPYTSWTAKKLGNDAWGKQEFGGIDYSEWHNSHTLYLMASRVTDSNPESIYILKSNLEDTEQMCYASSTLDAIKWNTSQYSGSGGYWSISDSELTVAQTPATGLNEYYVHSNTDFLLPAIHESRIKVTQLDSTHQSIEDWGFASVDPFINGTFLHMMRNGGASYKRFYCDNVGSPSYTDLTVDPTSYHEYKLSWISGSSSKVSIDDGADSTVTTNIPTMSIPVSFFVRTEDTPDKNAEIVCDWIFVRKYSPTEPTTSLGAEEASSIVEYVPPTPTSISNTTGNFWGNHTWQAGAGNVTDSYNVSVNSVWHNTSPAHYNDTYSPNAWQNITVYAFNSTGAGTLSAANVTQDTQIPDTQVTISLHSVSPDTIHTNYTGAIQVNYTVESNNPLNLSTLAMLYGVNYTTTGDMHSYIAVPPNSISSEGIYRAPNRNTTPYLSWENNATITEGNVWQWGGGDNDSWWITKTPINATHTWINATGIPEHVFQSSFYLKKTSMYSAPKTEFNINSQQGLIIKMWDNEAIRGRSVGYILNMYFDSDWQSTIPTSPIEIWGFNSSFNPDTDDPATSEWGAKIVEWDGNRWVNHSWVPGSNASYAYPLIFNASSFPVIPDEINYIYLKSATQSSKSYVLNATNCDPGICNLTYAQTETMWTYSELADVSTPVAYTPSFFTTFVRDDEEFLHHMYIADDQGEWAHSGINYISIGVSHFPVSASSFDYFNVTCPTFGHTLDTGMGSTYDNGYIHIGIYCYADPDGGTVSHNITLHYVNETIAGVINDTFQTTSSGLYEINFTTAPYYSTTDAYTLKCVSTDDEASVATTWLDSFFTLASDGTQGYYVDDYLMFWGMNDIPTLHASVANNSLISYDAGSDIYTMHVPFFKSKCNDTFRFNETVHLESLNTEDVAYFRFGGETIFDNTNIHGWDTVSDMVAPSTDTYRGYVYACCRTTGNITNSNLSYLGSDVYQQEGVNFIDNTIDYLIYNTTFSHNSRGIIMEECENINISHCDIHDNVETGIGVYYSDNMVVENCTISDSSYDPGLYLYESSDNAISYNNIIDCADYGMRIRSNSNNNTLLGNDISGGGIYDYYFSSAAINNTIRDPASTTDKIRATSTSEVNIENSDNTAFTEDSSNHTYAYPTNFSMSVTGASHTFDITQRDMTITPSSDSIRVWNLVWATSVAFNASNASGSPHVWFNATQSIWANTNMTVYRNGSIYYNGTADANGLFAYNYSGGWSEHWFEFSPENVAPDKPTVVIPANGATGTSTNPTLRVQVTDPNDYDSLDVTFYAQGGAQIGSTQTGITNGGTASVVWSGRSYSTTYYWYAVVDDGTAQTQSDTWHFRTQSSGSGSSHVIAITGCTDWSGNAGNQVYTDFGCTGETAGTTFTTNATNGSIDSSTGVYTWNTNAADAGVYTWRFNVENVYSVSDYCDVTITVYHHASPTNLAATTGNFWGNHTWDGNGFMDSYNVSVNAVWVNGSTNKYSYHVLYPHAWSNISVAAFNDSTGLSSFISNDVQVPNNAIVLTNYTTLMLATAGDNVTVDMNHEDLDGDTATYYCSRMDLFADFNTADGTGQYTNTINGTHDVIFGVTDGYWWSNQTITIEVGTVHPLELDEETPLLLFVVLVVLLFGSLFYIYHAASYVAKIVTALISTWMSFMLSNMAVSGNVVLNYAELSAGDVFIYGAHSIQIAALSHFFMFTGVVSALFMLVFAIKLVIDTYLDMQEKRKADEEWDGVEQQ